MISAEVVCDSVSKQGHRLTTFKLRYPKFIHGEAKTHRVERVGNEGGYFVLEQEVGLMDDPHLSRNASSSRAVPTEKLLQEVRDFDLMVRPMFWGKNQKGMQAAEELSDVEGHPDGPRSPRFQAEREWVAAAHSAARHAEALLKIGAHKQIVNRILEPFTHINVVATATEWNNFFGLRLHKAAQPEMRALAIAMWNARKASVPALLNPGEWHLPFVDVLDKAHIIQNVNSVTEAHEIQLQVSIARTARVSYESLITPGKRSTVEEDLLTVQKLNIPGTPTYNPDDPIHASPAEHQGTPDVWRNIVSSQDQQEHGFEVGWQNRSEHGNFVGWRQYRKMLPGEACAPLPKEFQ